MLVNNNGTILTKQDCKIYVPYDYLKYRLLTISDRTDLLAVCAIVSGNEYGVLRGCCKLTITPSTTKQVMVDGKEYMEFSFEAGSVMIPQCLTVKDSDLVYDMYKYFYSAGRVPAFLDDYDLGGLLDTHKEYGGINISPNNTPFEIVTSMLCRDSQEHFKYYRHTEMKKPPIIVPFNSVLFQARSTTAKLLGANLEDGFTSALLNPSETPDRLENLLRI